MTEKTGRCLCGSVRFTATGVNPHHHACHCSMCRRWAGGPLFCANVAGMTFEAAETLARYASSDWAERGFCRTCGSSLFYYLRPADQYVVAVGAFDDQAGFALADEIYIDRKPPGYALAGDHPRLTEAEFLARFSGSDDK